MIYRRHPAPGPEVFRKTAEREAEGAFHNNSVQNKAGGYPAGTSERLTGRSSRVELYANVAAPDAFR